METPAQRVNHLLTARRRSGTRDLDIALAGELDISNAGDLQALLERWVSGAADARCVSIDASELTFMDSSGVQVLVSLHRHLQTASRGLEIRDATPAVQLVLETLGLTALLGIVDERGPSDARLT